MLPLLKLMLMRDVRRRASIPDVLKRCGHSSITNSSNLCHWRTVLLIAAESVNPVPLPHTHADATPVATCLSTIAPAATTI